MPKIILNELQLRELIVANRYKIDEKTKFLSRCIDGRYPNQKELPALAIPGNYRGEMVVIFSAGNSFGFEVDKELAYRTLIEIIGGEKNLRTHTDCGYIKDVSLDPAAFSLEKDQLDFIKEKFRSSKEIVLQGEHLEGAVALVKGNFGVLPQYTFKYQEGDILAQVFVFHQTLIDQRHRILARKLIDEKAVKFHNRPFNQDDEDYLYTTLSETSEVHLFEISKRLAEGLPFYQVVFDNSGEFEISNLS